VNTPATQPPFSQEAWTTPQGTIRRGMKVIAADGTCIGTVARLEGDELMLEEGSGSFVALTQIDGVSADSVLLENRGDATFGLGAEP
jgi:hypothetical protein